MDNSNEMDYLQQNNRLHLNWLSLRRLFDFEQVEIIQATDEEVERFAVQVGNDTDPSRKGRYKKMTCVLSPAYDLNENTKKILQRMFGRLEIKPPVI